MNNELIKKIKLIKLIPIIGNQTKKNIIINVEKLINSNYKIIEITLRNDEALNIALDIKKKYSNIKIGLGSITSLQQLKNVSKYKFDFYISPGINENMLKFSNNKKLNYIPGVSTPSEIMLAMHYKFNLLKFFHAEKNGGISTLNIYKEIFKNIMFIPTGGINKKNSKKYLSLSNVICVGSTNY